MKKYITLIIGAFFLFALFSMMITRQFYTRNRPDFSQAELGRTIPVEVNYGKTVYLSKEDRRNLTISYWAFGLAATTAVLTMVINSIKSSAKKPVTLGPSPKG
jgi:hypothetical protein